MSHSVCSFTVIGRGLLSWGLISLTWQTWLLLHPSWCHWPQWKWPKCPGLEHPRHKQSCVECIGYFSYQEGKSGLVGHAELFRASHCQWTDVEFKQSLFAPPKPSQFNTRLRTFLHVHWPPTVCQLDANHARDFIFFSFQQIENANVPIVLELQKAIVGVVFFFSRPHSWLIGFKSKSLLFLMLKTLSFVFHSFYKSSLSR